MKTLKRFCALSGLALGLLVSSSPAAPAGDPDGEFAVSSSSSGQYLPVAAIDERGEVVVVWEEAWEIRCRRFNGEGNPRGGDFAVGPRGGQYLSSISAAMDRKGFSVVWGTFNNLLPPTALGRRFDNQGRPRTEAIPLGVNPGVASSPQGSSVVLAQADGIVGWRFDPTGRQIGRLFQVAPFPARLPRLAMDAQGNFVAVWVTPQGIFGRRFDAVARPRGPVFQVTRDPSDPEVAGNSHGSFVVSWLKNQGGILARFYTPAGETADRRPILVAGRPRSTSASAAMDEAGRVLMAWSCCQESGRARIFGRFFEADGEALDAELRISSGPGPDIRPVAAAGLDGDFLVVWQRGPTREAAGEIVGRWIASSVTARVPAR